MCFQKYLQWYPNNCPPRKIAPQLRLGFGSRSGLVLGLGGNQTIAPKENCPPVRVRVWLRVSFGVGGQFSSGAIVLEPSFINVFIWPPQKYNFGVPFNIRHPQKCCETEENDLRRKNSERFKNRLWCLVNVVTRQESDEIEQITKSSLCRANVYLFLILWGKNCLRNTYL